MFPSGKMTGHGLATNSRRQAFLTMWREIDREERLAAAERWAAERPVPAPALRLSGEALLRVGG